MRAYKTTVDFWAEDFKMKPLVTVEVKEVPVAGAVMQDDNVKVSATIVEHPPVKPALGYRFDFKDRSIAFSGDTAPFEAVAKMAKGADILVHEAMYVPELESYTRDEIAKGRPVKFEDVMAHTRMLAVSRRRRGSRPSYCRIWSRPPMASRTIRGWQRRRNISRARLSSEKI